MSKKEFSWDSEVLVKTIERSDKERHEVKICELNGKTYVSVTKVILFQKDGWKPVKNQVFEMGLFDEVVAAVSEWKEKQPKVLKGKKTETKEAAKPKKKPGNNSRLYHE